MPTEDHYDTSKDWQRVGKTAAVGAAVGVSIGAIIGGVAGYACVTNERGKQVKCEREIIEAKNNNKRKIVNEVGYNS